MPARLLRRRVEEGEMQKQMIVLRALLAMGLMGTAAHAQLGKSITIPAGSEADHQLNEINRTTDGAQKLALLDKFAAANTEGNMAIVADEQYVNYYLAAKNYDKAFEYGDKLFALDADNFQNAVNMVRAAQEKGDTDKLFAYGEKAGGIIQRYKSAPAPPGADSRNWERGKKETLDAIAENRNYIEQAMFNGAYRTTDIAKKGELFVRFANSFPDSQYASRALNAAAAAYEQTQNTTKMLDVANGVVAKDPENIGMLMLLADYYSEKGEKLNIAEGYAKKIPTLLDAAKKPDDVSDEQWKKQKELQKGVALSALGQVNIQTKDNAHAVENFRAAAPLLKQDDGSYARNQYRLGFALLNLKRIPEAKAAFTEAASVPSPYKALAETKLKNMGPASPSRTRKKS
jgi:tetratricopeptide (TPR) repeat protein